MLEKGIIIVSGFHIQHDTTLTSYWALKMMCRNTLLMKSTTSLCSSIAAMGVFLLLSTVQIELSMQVATSTKHTRKLQACEREEKAATLSLYV